MSDDDRAGEATGEFAGETLARFAVGTEAGTLPGPVYHQAKRALLNFTGAALGVARHPSVAGARRVLASLSGPAEATLFGQGERTDRASAAFLNAVAGNLLDYDDTHLRTVIHPTAPVAPAAIALAEAGGMPGRDLLAAFALGAEVECRLGNAVTPGHYARGWHITATCGVFGAAAACARLLGLDARQTWHALGIAASQSAGLVENLPHAAKNVGMGNAARGGLLAALFAAEGLDAAPAAIEGRLGWARACGDEPVAAEITGGLGERWEFLDNTYKPYPAGIVMHAIIDACLDLVHAGEVDAGQVDSVTVRGDALLLARGDRPVAGERDAKVSIHHCVAAPLLWGAAGVREFSDPCVLDPRAVELRARVRAELDPGQPVGAACVAVTLRDGRRVERTVEHARGSLAAPLSDADIEAKTRDLVAEGGSGCDPSRLIDAVWALAEAPDLKAFVDAVRGQRAADA